MLAHEAMLPLQFSKTFLAKFAEFLLKYAKHMSHSMLKSAAK